jgi:hypothetical protein
MEKCNNNYQSQYAFLDNSCIHIDEYLKIKKSNITCKNGHPLICANGKKNKPHFRHKHNEDLNSTPMTEWHCEWQGNFPNTEIEYKKKNDKQIKDRRADVSLDNSKYNLEFQHSFIDIVEVVNRKKDYELHGRKIIWIIHGNDAIKVKHLKYSNRFYLEFISDNWKYQSFIDYEYIFIDIDDMLYKIYPNEVKNNMIDVETPLDKETFIKYINENNEIIHNVTLPLQCNLYIKQQGAGNGKTFGLIQNIENIDFEHYKCFIIVTKQHSAKTIIYNELKMQIDNKYLNNITDLTILNENKKYQISYKNTNTNNTCYILIATIDALMYSLGNTKNTDINKFEGIVTSVINGYIEEQNIKSVNCNGMNYNLNKELCLVVDETQDLSEDYAKAIIRIMRDKYIDTYIVGDKLQSINIENNAFQHFSKYEFPYIQKKQYEPTNLCRRFYHNDLIKFINEIVPFSKYSLPEIEPYKQDDELDKTHLEFFEGENIYANDKDENKINKEVENILKYYDKEVQEYNYKPNDFLIVTPFTTKNALVNALEIAIETYWINKNNNNEYQRYAVFHKTEQGNSINLNDSENSTRIVSISTSKGDGRNVVFVIGLDEASLHKCSNKSNDLVYDSLIHVSLTRMKKKLYIRFINNGDDISCKIWKFICNNDISLNTDIKPQLNSIIKKIKYKEVIDYVFKKNNFQILKEVINDLNMNIDNPDEKHIIDMSHHNIRYASMIIYLYIKIINNEKELNNNEVRKQLKAIFSQIIKKDILTAFDWQSYNNYLKEEKSCILKITNNGKDYIRYYDIIVSIMKNVKIKLNGILVNKINTLCPLESVILYYMIETHHQGVYTDITMNELYNIIDIYGKSFNNSYDGHTNCSCKIHFNRQCIETNTNIEKMSKYLTTHYENINNVGKVYDTFLEKYPNVNWLINHKIIYNGTNDDFILSNKFKFIGYDTNNVFVVYVKPQFNQLNFFDTLMNSIYDTFLIKNIKKPTHIDDTEQYNKYLEDYNKFYDKNIITIVFSLDNKKYQTYEWCNNPCFLNNNKQFVEQIRNKLIDKYTVECKHIYSYYKYYKKQNKDLPAKKFIKDFIIKYKNEKYYDNPSFILRFFQKIEDDLLGNKNKEMYDDVNIFQDKLNTIITNSIDEYLNFEEDDE